MEDKAEGVKRSDLGVDENIVGLKGVLEVGVLVDDDDVVVFVVVVVVVVVVGKGFVEFGIVGGGNEDCKAVVTNEEGRGDWKWGRTGFEFGIDDKAALNWDAGLSDCCCCWCCCAWIKFE